MDLLDGRLFAGVLRSFVTELIGKGSEQFTFLESHGIVPKPAPGGEIDIGRPVDLLILLTSRPLGAVCGSCPEFSGLMEGVEPLAAIVEELYNHWRKMERYILIEEEFRELKIKTADYHQWFIETVQGFEDLVRETYRRIAFNVSGNLPRVYRQLPSGAGAGILLEEVPWDCPGGAYAKLGDIPFVRLVVLEPPIIYYSRRNVRKGSIRPAGDNPLEHVESMGTDWYCYPAKVGLLLIFVYFHRRFMNLGVSLSNLFELAKGDEVHSRQPDGIMVFGGEAAGHDPRETYYHEDAASELVVGYVSGAEDHDYFGYMKKTILTLHNVIMLNRGMLPLHGAMACIGMGSGRTVNVVIVGDSAAGKSETLEAFRVLAGEENIDLRIVFDDMGVLASGRDGRVLAYGTEIGAFVRLDDLSPGYAYSEMDRSIFINPQLRNARVVIPIAEHGYITHGHPVDVLLYANNYEEVDEEHPVLELYGDVPAALSVFESGARMAKGTTDETGLVHSYFANPFGATQKRREHETIARFFFERLLASGCPIGMLRTRLGIKRYETAGPQEAARVLLEHFFR